MRQEIFRAAARSAAQILYPISRLLASGVDVPAGGARRSFVIFGDGPMAGAVAALVPQRRSDSRLDSRGR